MNISSQFNTRIASLLDTYQHEVPLSRLILEATRLNGLPLKLNLVQEHTGEIFLFVTFGDGSEVSLAVTEEM